MDYSMKIRERKGITLIALVVTIIVLLILAGISITMLTGQNGILNRAQEAKNKTEQAKEDEKEKLQGYEDIINKYKDLPKGEGTTPYLPNDMFWYKEGDLSTGLVIKDFNNNEYVWVEVPRTAEVYTTAGTNITNFTDGEYTKIETDLKEYTKDYRDLSYSDTNPDFTTQYKNMLKSIYTNGGFWIGRYEAGYEIDESKGETVRDYGEDYYTEYPTTQKVVIKENAYPYNWVRINQAQDLAIGLNYGDCRGSLLFGIQWDLVLKYIEEKTVDGAEEANKITARTDIREKLTSNSSTIGNYFDSEFTLNRGKFAQYGELSNWFNYNSGEKKSLIEECKKKTQSSYENAILLTTGATEATKLQNIYDIAGNVWEWTLEFSTTNSLYVIRGGSCVNGGSDYAAKSRYDLSTSDSPYNLSFRIGLWK